MDDKHRGLWICYAESVWRVLSWTNAELFYSWQQIQNLLLQVEVG